MENVWITLITVFGGIIATFVSLFVWKVKQNKQMKNNYETERKEEQKRQKAKDEIANFTFGQVSLLLNENIKIVPDLKKEFNESYDRYRSLDLVKIEVKKEEK